VQYRQDGGSWQALPPSMLLPVMPGAALPVSLAVNGVPALPACSSEGDSSSTAEGCSFAFTQEATPSISAVSPKVLSAQPAELSIAGSGFGSNAQLVSVTVGGQPCPLSRTVSDGSSLACLAPALPAGSYLIELMVAGKGRALVLAGSSAATVTYQPAVASITPAAGSLFGGTEVVLTGHGFASTAEPAQDRMPAAKLGSIPCAITSATTTSIQCTSGSSASSTSFNAAPAVESRNASTGAVMAGTSATNSSTPFRRACSWLERSTSAVGRLLGEVASDALPCQDRTIEF